MPEIFHHPVQRPLGVLSPSTPPRPAVSTSEELFRSLFERSGVCIASLDPLLRVRSANADLLAMLDRDADEVEGFEFADLVHTDGRAQLRVRFEDLRASRYSRFTEHVTVRRPDGTEVAGTLTAVLVRGASRVTNAVLVVVQIDPVQNTPSPVPARDKLLSDVDAKILEGVAAGASTIQLAAQLYLSRQGVEYHVSSMLRRLRVPNRPALVSRAYTMGILGTGTWPPRVRQDYVY